MSCIVRAFKDQSLRAEAKRKEAGKRCGSAAGASSPGAPFHTLSSSPRGAAPEQAGQEEGEPGGPQPRHILGSWGGVGRGRCFCCRRRRAAGDRPPRHASDGERAEAGPRR